jgi:hypothetical protein
VLTAVLAGLLVLVVGRMVSGSSVADVTLTAAPNRVQYYHLGSAEALSRPVSPAHRMVVTCADVERWALATGAVPIDNGVDLTIQGPTDAAVEVLGVSARVGSSRPVDGDARVRCAELIHVDPATDYTVDLAAPSAIPPSPARPVTLDRSGLMPRGEATVHVAVHGAERTEYTFYLEVSYLVDRVKHVTVIGDGRLHGPTDTPLRTVVERDPTTPIPYEWNLNAHSWSRTSSP